VSLLAEQFRLPNMKTQYAVTVDQPIEEAPTGWPRRSGFRTLLALPPPEKTSLGLCHAILAVPTPTWTSPNSRPTARIPTSLWSAPRMPSWDRREERHTGCAGWIPSSAAIRLTPSLGGEPPPWRREYRQCLAPPAPCGSSSWSQRDCWHICGHPVCFTGV